MFADPTFVPSLGRKAEVVSFVAGLCLKGLIAPILWDSVADVLGLQQTSKWLGGNYVHSNSKQINSNVGTHKAPIGRRTQFEFVY